MLQPELRWQVPSGATTSASYSSTSAIQRTPAAPMTTTAVAYASAQVNEGPVTVALKARDAGRPVKGSMTWAPRSAVPEVATAKSRPDTTVSTRLESRGLLMPTVQG